MAPATAGPRPLSAEAAASRQIEVMPQPVNGLATLRLLTHPRLPSGLNAVSSAVILDRILAVDPEGALFLSRDATKHWERVPIQWTGKAVAVQAPPRELYPMNAAAQKIRLCLPVRSRLSRSCRRLLGRLRPRRPQPNRPRQRRPQRRFPLTRSPSPPPMQSRDARNALQTHQRSPSDVGQRRRQSLAPARGMKMNPGRRSSPGIRSS